MLRLGSSVRRRSAKGKVWGSDEVNVEGWKPLKRLVGHESGEFYMRSVSGGNGYKGHFPDVTDVAWSPGDRYLASVGLDSAVLVWCGYTLGESDQLPVSGLRFELSTQSGCGRSTNTRGSSRVYAGILLGSSLLRALMTGLSEYGERRIGN